MIKLKLKHTLAIQEDGVTIKGQITDVIWNDNERGDCCMIYNDTKTLFIISSTFPFIDRYCISIWGIEKQYDNNIIQYTYDTPEKAQEMIEFIMENTIKEEEEDINDNNTITTGNQSDTELKAMIFDLMYEESHACRGGENENNSFADLAKAVVLYREYRDQPFAKFIEDLQDDENLKFAVTQQQMYLMSRLSNHINKNLSEKHNKI